MWEAIGAEGEHNANGSREAMEHFLRMVEFLMEGGGGQRHPQLQWGGRGI